jgi:hypothetical protein
MRKYILMTVILLSAVFFLNYKSSEKPLKVLHVCFHDGCIHEIEGVAKALSLDLTSWNAFKLPPYSFDPAENGGYILYQMDKNRANRIWEKNKDYFNQFDAILTSDTTPLSRIFIQNDWNKPLIVWVSNRFDWYPTYFQNDYYDLLNDASKNKKNVFFVNSSPFEMFYAKQKQVDLGNCVIAACAANLPPSNFLQPVDLDRNSKIFVHKRTQEVQSPHCNISEVLKKYDIPAYCDRYETLEELQAFKGVLYLPYQWYVISLFETLKLGLPTFVPTERFLLEMINGKKYVFESPELATVANLQTYSEWYNPEIKKVLIYFDSWEDLKKKVAETDYQSARRKSWEFGQNHEKVMIQRWKEVFGKAKSVLKD